VGLVEVNSRITYGKSLSQYLEVTHKATSLAVAGQNHPPLASFRLARRVPELAERSWCIRHRAWPPCRPAGDRMARPDVRGASGSLT
jgi:hypothetical protein